MVDPLPSLASLKESYERLDKARKNHIKLSLVIFIAAMGLIFYFFSQRVVYAQKQETKTVLTPEIIDPLNKIGKGLKTENGIVKEKKIADNPKFSEMLSGFPMQEMTSALSEMNNETAAYLIAIAKKESDWGKYSPKKEGKECYNFWGYRGQENTTDSGYSCFDSPEHAVATVGGRIESLLEKKINTPEKLIVWKCGSTCAGHDPAGVKKWISDVAYYHSKLSF